MNWNIEGLISVIEYLNSNIIIENDIIILTETFLTRSWNSSNHYAIHLLATQGQVGRPKGGISILPKP
jgi:hypothetical protein